MITLDKLLKELSPVSLNEIVAGFERGEAGGWSYGNMKNKKDKSNKSSSNKSSSNKSSSHKSKSHHC